MSIVFFTGHMQPFGHIYEIASTCELRVAVICSTHEPQMDVVYLVLVSHDGSMGRLYIYLLIGPIQINL